MKPLMLAISLSVLACTVNNEGISAGEGSDAGATETPSPTLPKPRPVVDAGTAADAKPSPKPDANQPTEILPQPDAGAPLPKMDAKEQPRPDADTPTPPIAWSPNKLVGLAVWLDASEDSHLKVTKGGAVLRWVDRSVNKNDAVPSTAGGALPQFVFTPDDVGHIAFSKGGRPLVVSDSESLRFGEKNFIACISARYHDQQGRFSHLFAKQLGHAPYTGLVVFSNVPETFVGPAETGTAKAFLADDQQTFSLGGGFDDGEVHVYCAARLNNTFSFSIDQIAQSEVRSAETDVSAPGFALFLGGPLSFEGSILQVVAAAGNHLGADDLRDTAMYLLSKR